MSIFTQFKIRLLIIDDHPLFRQGVRFFLESIPEIELAGEAGNGADGLVFLSGNPVDIVLMDLQMPGMDGIEVTEKIKERWPDIKVLVLSSFNSWDKVYSALKKGAAGYVLKDAPPEELLAGIKAVAAGGSFLGAKVATELLNRLGNDPAVPTANDLPEPLTEREIDVLKLIGQGLGNREIAEQLVVSEKTVKTHVANILQKLQVKSRTQAALYAIQHQLI
jgi:two-component system, NarL family, response regulator LiaR